MAGERYVIPRSDFDALVNLTFGVLSRACSCDKMYRANCEYIIVVSVCDGIQVGV